MFSQRRHGDAERKRERAGERKTDEEAGIAIASVNVSSERCDMLANRQRDTLK